MLKFIFGLPCSGKTFTVLQKIKALAEENKQIVFIVPEQSSFECEKSILMTLGDSFAFNVNVLPFSRILDEIQQKIGGGCNKILTDTDKIIFMHKALIEVSGELKLWGRYAHSISFAKTMLDTIGEFKINSVFVDDILNASKKSTSSTLKAKLDDIALIYKTYDLLISERFIDSADNLTKLYERLKKYHFFKEKTVFIDGFKGFTGQQFKIIERILSQADDVYISLTNDIKSNKEFNVFSNIRSAILRIEEIAKKHNVKIDDAVFLDKPYYNSENLFNIERLISGNIVSCKNQDESITVCKANSIYDEAEFVARNIRRLVRENNYRFKDFVIISRDSEKYKEAVDYACKKNNVNCFFDEKIPLKSFPLSVAADAAIKALNLSSENILRFHKSGISYLTLEEISSLENYIFLWNINGSAWLENWDMDVRGFVTDEATEGDITQLNTINEIKNKAITPILNFKQNFNTNAKLMSKAIMQLITECGAADKLKAISERFKSEGNIFSSDALKQSYDAFINVLDSMVTCFGDKNIKINEFHEALNLAFSTESVGLIPQTLDQVTFGSADHIRPSQPKIAFIMGANQGVFPQFSENRGVFALNERRKIIELGIEIVDNAIYNSIDENYLVYCNLCCATDKLFISYSASSLKGEVLEPSTFLTSILENIAVVKVSEPLDYLSFNNLPETENSALYEFCRRINFKEQANTIKKSLKNSENTDRLISTNYKNEKFLEKENAKKLFGSNLNMSATKFDTFNRCKFSFFCKYGLNAKKLQSADFDVLQRGTIVHYVLEKIITVHKENIKDFDKQKLDSLCELYINEYLDLVDGFRTVFTAKHKFLISKITRSLKEVVYHLSKEFAQSDFKPIACELKIGGQDGIPLKFSYAGGEINVFGSIDRVDEYNGFIRIVDYKTGSKSFKLPDILFGLNLQMLIYLYAVIRADSKTDDKAAGILYMPSKRDLNNEGMAMNGLLRGDKQLITAMEKENNGEFVPHLSINKDGSISKTANSFITDNEFSKIFDYIEKLMNNVGNSISSGDISVKPVDGRESAACDYCDYKSVCGFENGITFKVPNLKNNEVFELMEVGENNGI